MDTLSLYASTYLMVDVFCIIMGVVIIRKVGRSFGSELEIRYFKNMIGFYLLFCLTDALWLPIDSGLIPPNVALNAALSSVNMISTALVAFFWYCFAQAKMHIRDLENRTSLVVSQIPLLILFALYVANPFNHCMFSISLEGTFVKGPLYMLAPVLTGGYILFVAGQAIVRMLRAENKAQRGEYTVFVRFAIIPAISSCLDPVFPNTPIIALSILTAILFVFSSMQESRIFNDALTGLNNRRRADQYLVSKISSASVEHPVYVYVLDVNLFKRINDTQGHVEGDHALQIVADSLRGAAGRSRGFVARWGGDEFLLVADSVGVDSPDAVIAMIDQTLQEAKNRAGLSYDLSISAGYAICTSPAEDPGEVLGRADDMLYEHKREAHERAAA